MQTYDMLKFQNEIGEMVEVGTGLWSKYTEKYEARSGRINLVLKGRSTGMTTWAAAKAFTCMMAGGTAISVCPTVEQAERIFSLVLEFRKNLPERLADEFGTLSVNAHRRMQSSRRGEFESQVGSNYARWHGKKYDFIHISNPGYNAEHVQNEIYNSLIPQLTEHGEMMIETTPSVRVGQQFWWLWDMAPSLGYVTHMIGR
jgi:hypothetical protein